MTSDPIRWTDPSSDASDAIRRVLEAAAADEPTAAQLERIASSLTSKLGVSTGVPAAAAKAGVATSKIVLVLGAVVMIAAGGLWYARGERTPSLERDAVVAEVATDPVPVSPPPESAPAPESAPPRESAPPSLRPRPVAPRRSVAPKAHHAEELAPPPPAVDEVSMLKAAQGALATDPARALALAERHAREHATSQLGEEREAIAVEALARLDRTADAKVRFDRFVATFPRSGYRARLERLL
jgi:hypothetical protein